MHWNPISITVAININETRELFHQYAACINAPPHRLLAGYSYRVCVLKITQCFQVKQKAKWDKLLLMTSLVFTGQDREAKPSLYKYKIYNYINLVLLLYPANIIIYINILFYINISLGCQRCMYRFIHLQLRIPPQLCLGRGYLNIKKYIYIPI